MQPLLGRLIVRAVIGRERERRVDRRRGICIEKLVEEKIERFVNVEEKSPSNGTTLLKCDEG